MSRVTHEANKFEQEHERKPSSEELMQLVDLPQDKIDEALNAHTCHVSMDAPFADGEDSSLIDVMEDTNSPMADRELVRESLRAEIENALKTLSNKERSVIEALYGINSPEMTMEEVGEKYGLSRERVRQIKEKAIRRLRNNTNNTMLKSYLGQ